MQQSFVKTAIWAVALVCAALILANGGAVAQRVMIPPEEPAPPAADSDSVPVAVTNFPTVDIRGFPHVVTVEGTVDVGNFPATQNVVGTVEVGNLPLDADGNVRVSNDALEGLPQLRFLGLTQASFAIPPAPGELALSRGCAAEFPNSRACVALDLFEEVPPPAAWQEPLVWVILTDVSAACSVAGDRIPFCMDPSGKVGLCPAGSFPVACCGY